MKKLYPLLLLCSFSILLENCIANPKIPGDEITANTGSLVVNESKKEVAIEVHQNRFVVQFDDGITESQKDSIRNANPIIRDAIQTCSCGSNDVELWYFDDSLNPLDIEGAINGLTGGGGGGVEGEPDFDFTIPVPVEDFEPRGFNEALALSLVDKTSAPSVNIAVIDTGIDLTQYSNADPFLYATKCGDPYSGWNFVDGDAIVEDNHGHGTFVTKIITEQLDKHNASYRILPVKAFDGNGTGSYWDVICAMNYIKYVQNRNGDIHLVNASFGHTLKYSRYNRDSHTPLAILEDIIRDLEANTLVIASAGNQGIDNDASGSEHFPSGFALENIIGVGGYIQDNTGLLTKAGNYGSVSIDAAAPYSQNFTLRMPNVPLSTRASGTSYGTAYTTAILAKMINSNFTLYLAAPGLFANKVKSDFLDPANSLTNRSAGLSGFIVDQKYVLK